MTYQSFLAQKTLVHVSEGRNHDHPIHPMLFPFQQDITRWALKKGRCAIFADTGLGKTFMQLEWARLIGGTVLIVAPLSVARQTIGEGLKIGVTVRLCRSAGDVQPGVNITNYEMIQHFDPEAFSAVVLDESSILKSIDGKTKAKLIAMFKNTPYRLCCTATPAPNDIAEIANHTEFLGIMSRQNMLAAFFVHDDKGWRLKGHATEPFYRWMASWAMSVKKPSDLGYEDDGFVLPPLTIHPVIAKSSFRPVDRLVFTGLKGISDRSQVRKGTLTDRLQAVTGLIQNGDQYLIWCGLNDEATAIAKAVDGAVNVQGSDDLDHKVSTIESFQKGDVKVLVTKAKIAGFGMNFQNCNKVIFMGMSDSYEAYYQCIRRCYRFGQKRPVDIYIVLSEPEEPIFNNVLQKEREAQIMADNLVKHVTQYEKEELFDSIHRFNYSEDKTLSDDYQIFLGDSCERMKEIPDESVHLSVFSPPFMSLYTYSPTERDIGNCKDAEEFFSHFHFVIQELYRVTKPGRNCCVHCADVGLTAATHGVIGLHDFPGALIRAFQNYGWIYHGRVTIDKNPQAQAIRTHAKALLFVQKNKDSSWSRPALADYIIIFRKPGANEEPIKNDISNEEWIEWAHPVWYGIKETDTLNVAEARENNDERHICPLQLGTIERCIRLWSNRGETVLDPFAGIGSTGYEALLLGRKFIGIELKKSYFDAANRNLVRAKNKLNEGGLF